ncbi:MAG: hypothetical protein AB7O38_08620 [Pirellulaceae bacterium]
MQKHYVDANGKFLGSFDCSALPADKQAAWFAKYVPQGAVEVQAPPKDGRATWDGAKFIEPAPEAPKPTLEEEIATLKTKIAALEAQPVK